MDSGTELIPETTVDSAPFGISFSFESTGGDYTINMAIPNQADILVMHASFAGEIVYISIACLKSVLKQENSNF